MEVIQQHTKRDLGRNNYHPISGTATCKVKGRIFYDFELKIFESRLQAERILSREFYKQSLYKIPADERHFEVEIISAPQVLLDNEFVNIHNPKDTKRKFICYTEHVPEEKMVMQMVMAWAVLSVWATENGQHAYRFLDEYDLAWYDFGAIIYALKMHANIVIKSSSFKF